MHSIFFMSVLLAMFPGFALAASVSGSIWIQRETSPLGEVNQPLANVLGTQAFTHTGPNGQIDSANFTADPSQPLVGIDWTSTAVVDPSSPSGSHGSFATGSMIFSYTFSLTGPSSVNVPIQFLGFRGTGWDPGVRTFPSAGNPAAGPLLQTDVGFSISGSGAGTLAPVPGYSQTAGQLINGARTVQWERRVQTYVNAYTAEYQQSAFAYQSSIQAGTTMTISMFASVNFSSYAHSYVREVAWIDPFIQIDPTWAAANPGDVLSVEAGIANSPAVVPEPGTLIQALCGLLLIGLRRGRSAFEPRRAWIVGPRTDAPLSRIER